MNYLISIKESIKDILSTPLGSRIMRPHYGSRLHELIDRRRDNHFQALATQYIIKAIHANEPRVRVRRVIWHQIDHQLNFSLVLDAGDEMLFSL